MTRELCARKVLSAVLLLVFPMRLVRVLLNCMGHRIQSGARVGLSLIWCDRLVMEAGARVGHGNVIAVRRVLMRKGAVIGRANVVHGPLSLALGPRAALGNRNSVLRAGKGVTQGPSRLRLGELAKITSDHRVDCTQSVSVGAFSTIAGSGSQIWTHGYVHDERGEGRYRIDGRVTIGDNVYVGSAAILSMGISIGRGVMVGAGTTIAKSLEEPGLYVSAAVRRLPRPPQPQERTDLQRLVDPNLVEAVYVKRMR